MFFSSLLLLGSEFGFCVPEMVIPRCCMLFFKSKENESIICGDDAFEDMNANIPWDKWCGPDKYSKDSVQGHDAERNP